jgi:hypothetical protein
MFRSVRTVPRKATWQLGTHIIPGVIWHVQPEVDDGQTLQAEAERQLVINDIRGYDVQAGREILAVYCHIPWQ